MEVEGRAAKEERMVRRVHYWETRTVHSLMVLKELSLLEVEGKPLVVPTAVAFMVVNREVIICLCHENVLLKLGLYLQQYILYE